MGMTNAEVRRFLHSIKEQDEELERKLVQIAELRTAVENCTAKLDKDGAQSSKGGSKVENLMCKIIDLEKECENLRMSADGKRKTVLEYANSLTQEQHRDYLVLRFVECHGFYDTTMMMSEKYKKFSDSKARRIDRKVISDLSRATTTISSGLDR